MKTVDVKFKNYIDKNSGLISTFIIKGCLVANSGGSNVSRPEIIIHLPKNDKRDVDGSFVEWDGYNWHVVGTTAVKMDENTPTRWDRFATAERIKYL